MSNCGKLRSTCSPRRRVYASLKCRLFHDGPTSSGIVWMHTCTPPIRLVDPSSTPPLVHATVITEEQLRFEAAQQQYNVPRTPATAASAASPPLQYHVPMPPPLPQQPQQHPQVYYASYPRQYQQQQQLVHGHFGRHSCAMVCPFCETGIRTRVRDKVDGITIMIVIALLCVFWPLFWLPFCMPKCKSTHHYCPKCHQKVGITDPCS